MDTPHRGHTITSDSLVINNQPFPFHFSPKKKKKKKKKEERKKERKTERKILKL